MLENEIQEIRNPVTHSDNQDNNAQDKYDARIEGNIIRMSIGAFRIVSLKVIF
jgi:hypothetical protein